MATDTHSSLSRRQRLTYWVRDVDPVWWLDKHAIRDWWLKTIGERKPDSERPLSEQTEIHLSFEGEHDDGTRVYWHKGRKEFCILPPGGSDE